MKTLHTLASVAALCIVPASCPAALVSTNELEMDAIYSQASFGSNTVDIRFNAPVTVVNPGLLSIETEAELLSLLAQGPASSPSVNMYFVDALDWCGVHNASIVGCATLPGNDVIVESPAAAGAFGGELNAHELAHNLGVDHSASGLMSSTLGGNTTLTTDQVNTILASPLIQFDGSQRFVSITPVVVSAVPEPASWILSGIALCGLGFLARRRRPHSRA